MDSTLIGSDEEARLASLREYSIDATLGDPGFDRLVHLAQSIFRVPVALVSLVDAQRQLFAASVGLNVCQTSRDVSFCAHAILRDEIMVILDAQKDSRFCNNALVTGEPHIRFYAGAPLRNTLGYALGTLCLIDTEPRDAFSNSERRNLSELAALVLDKLEVRRLEFARRSSQSRFENIAATSPDAIICADQQGLVTFWNPAADRLLGYRAENILGRSIDLIAPQELINRVHELATAGASLIEGRTIELNVHAASGASIPVELSASMWRENGRPSFGAILRDITERRTNEERLFQLAHIDSLTGLANRTMFRSRVEQTLSDQSAACVMMVDLDGFKDVNDSLGHSAGDAVLVTVARRLESSVRALDTLARMGGDEFSILIPGLVSASRAAEIADTVIESLSRILTVDGQAINIGASVGIAMCPEHGSSVRELLSSADLALYQAKAEGRHCHRFYKTGLREAATDKRAYQSEVLRAFEHHEFELYYQPQVRLSDGALIGAEALLRWRHPEKGLLGPGAFLSALEAGYLAPRMGDWIIRTACNQAARWRAHGSPEFRMGVNLFGAQFRTGDLASRVRAALIETGLPASALELEITENIILRHDDQMIGPLRELRDDGVGIAFDDYGTGYASLSMLKRYPLTKLKIDQTFVRGMCESSADAAIVRAILYLGHSFGLEVIAEGVETEEQSARLRKKGCETAQGYLFGRPMPASEFARQFGLSE
ncbi:response regulator receiver modulated diguanylate cyclase/phosphodiesterase [Caballeronia sordidicola]|uniref:Response regulator receiver modulated diguanylate cyclase/phosphodiesterase n=1 Tax=Caballeronia sordidicola TaxID=196367 RepID=A0A158I0H1_CABSO|nr:EAL domain-containing protein [Caballeronia sordidicola]SAL50115.1 response regulator receiver modulated diguanylate cyclase/phosphodiesterase [Caballeronia sordidicola]